MEEILLTASAAAREIRKSEGMVRIYAASGKLPCIRTSTGVRLFRKSDLEKFINKKDTKPSSEALSPEAT